jgi:lipopolysaccharide assembly outer membrane protein LptD (OstA)
MIIFVSLSLIIFLSFFAFAQEEEKEESTVNLSADQVIYDKSTDKMVFTGNVVITQEDIILTALEAEFDVDKKIGQIKSDIKMVQTDITITGDSLEAYLNDKRYIFSEKVKLIQERKDKEEKEDNIIWNCNNLEIFTDTRNLTATENVQILKKDFTITTDKAIYNDKEDKIDLTGKVRIEEENGRWISGDNAVFYIETEKLEVQGNVQSGIKLD